MVFTQISEAAPRPRKGHRNARHPVWLCALRPVFERPRPRPAACDPALGLIQDLPGLVRIGPRPRRSRALGRRHTGFSPRLFLAPPPRAGQGPRADLCIASLCSLLSSHVLCLVVVTSQYLAYAPVQQSHTISYV